MGVNTNQAINDGMDLMNWEGLGWGWGTAFCLGGWVVEGRLGCV